MTVSADRVTAHRNLSQPDLPGQALPDARRESPPLEAGVPSDADWLRREMGRELAARRRAAGMSQAELAACTRRYSRATVSHAEMGKDDVGRGFWEAADQLLAAGGFFAGAWDLLRDAGPRPRAPVASGEPGLGSDPAMRSAVPGQALRAYRQRGWPVAGHGGGLALATGKAADALEVGRVAGMIAAGAWQETNGAESIVRGLPPLPPCARSLAAIDAGARWYFLVEPGSCPWPAARPAAGGAEPRIRWHAAGGTVPVPPGGGAAWAHLPAAGIRLPPPQAVLDLLGWAVARVTSPGTLTVRGGVTVASGGQG